MTEGNGDGPRKIVLPEIKAMQPLEARARDGLVAKYSLFKEKVNPKSGIVYYPASATDISPSVAFPDSRVIYADIDDESMKVVRKKGFEGHTASALEFDPGDVDILVLLNPAIRPDIPASHVVKDGYVLCNDYHQTASDLKKKKGYELTAIIRPGKDNEFLYDTQDLDDYWKEVDTDESFQQAPFDWGAVNYNAAADVVERITGKKENVLAEYMNILEMAREQERQKNATLIAENPTLSDVLRDPDKADELSYEHQGQSVILETQLPRKKGTVDDIFVFKKVEESFPQR